MNYYARRCDDPTATDIVCDDQVVAHAVVFYAVGQPGACRADVQMPTRTAKSSDVFYNSYRAGRDTASKARPITTWIAT